MDTLALDKKIENKRFFKYVSQNILGMIGISAYVLADTFFISIAEGTNGITALNLVLPIYSVIYAIGAMIGVGSATRFSIYRARGDKQADYLFSNAIIYAFIFSLIFIIAGGCFPNKILVLLGADSTILKLGIPYTRIFMILTPFFMWNYIINAFVRNDGNPSLSMCATITSSLFNIVFDYILMFPLGMGMAGAALATAISPIIGILICMIHFTRKANTIRFVRCFPSIRRLIHSIKLGISAFIGEMTSGITTMVFNFIILGLTGNMGVAAFGIIANIAIVATSIFNGISFGSQPLLSEYFGKGKKETVRRLFKMSLITGIVFAGIVIFVTMLVPDVLVDIFNRDNDVNMANEAIKGMRLYFVGYLFASINIAGAGYLSATENAMWAFIISILRGFIAITVCAFVLSMFFGMTGVWIAFPVSEAVTMIALLIGIKRSKCDSHS